MVDLGAEVPKTADDELAEKIVEAIGAAKLIKDGKLNSIKDGLRKGSLSSHDWKLLIELGSPAQNASEAK